MNTWQKLLITLFVMLIASFAAGWFWRQLFDTSMPSYLAGMAGGLSALPVWELLRWLDTRA